jgi:ribosomal protein S13
MHKEVLHARGLESDDRISKLSEEKLKEILEEVRKLRHRRTTYHNVCMVVPYSQHSLVATLIHFSCYFYNNNYL